MEILVLGGDSRYISMMNNLNYNITCVGYEKENLNNNISCIELENVDISTFDIIVLPILGIKDKTIKTLNCNLVLDDNFFNDLKKDTTIYTGIINDEMKELFKHNNLISFLTDLIVNKKNDILTIKGVIKDIDDKKKDNVTILGFGNLGTKLASSLSGYNIKIGVNDKDLLDVFKDKFFLTTNKEEMKVIFKESDVVINTVPNNIIDEDMIKDTNAYILDIASYPYGINQEIAKNYSNYKLYSAIPSKYAPDQAGKILSKKIERDIRG